VHILRQTWLVTNVWRRKLAAGGDRSLVRSVAPANLWLPFFVPHFFGFAQFLMIKFMTSIWAMENSEQALLVFL